MAGAKKKKNIQKECGAKNTSIFPNVRHVHRKRIGSKNPPQQSQLKTREEELSCLVPRLKSIDMEMSGASVYPAKKIVQKTKKEKQGTREEQQVAPVKNIHSSNAKGRYDAQDHRLSGSSSCPNMKQFGEKNIKSATRLHKETDKWSTSSKGRIGLGPKKELSSSDTLSVEDIVEVTFHQFKPIDLEEKDGALLYFPPERNGWTKMEHGYREMFTRGTQTLLSSSAEMSIISDDQNGIDCIDCDQHLQEEEISRVNKGDFVKVKGLVRKLKWVFDGTEYIPSSTWKQIGEKDCEKETVIHHDNGAWKKYHHDHVLPALLVISEHTRSLEECSKAFRLSKDNEVLSILFYAWRKSTMRHTEQELLEHVNGASTKLFRTRRKNIMKVWSAIALGTNSKKKILERRRDGLARARSNLEERLWDKNESMGLIITHEMVAEEVRRIVNCDMADWIRKRYLGRCFGMLKNSMRYTRNQRAAADNDFEFKIKTKIFSKWLVWSSERSQNFQHAWNCPSVCNCDVINLLARKRLLYMVFRPWKQFASTHALAKLMRRRIFSNIVAKYFHSWRVVASRHRTLRSTAVSRWRCCHDELFVRPFRAWRSWTAAIRERYEYHNRLISVYNSSKNRRYLRQMFKSWRHQATYGRIWGMYNRAELVNLLITCQSKYKHLEGRIQGCDEYAKKEQYQTEQLSLVKNELHLMVGKLQASEDARQKADEEVARLGQIVECVKRVEPSVTKVISTMQPFLELAQNEGWKLS